MFTKFHAHKKYGTLKKHQFLQGSMLKFTYKAGFGEQKMHMRESWIDNPTGSYMLRYHS
jgi:hypothetical protein